MSQPEDKPTLPKTKPENEKLTGKHIVILGFVAILIIMASDLILQNQDIQNLKTQLDKTNLNLSTQINKTNALVNFDQQVINWANTINTQIQILNQTKK